MAKYDLKFIDSVDEDDWIQTYDNSTKEENQIVIQGENLEREFVICLDISTAIKFAKTLRTEINKAKEVSNEFERLSNTF